MSRMSSNDVLPPGQPLIETSSVTKARQQIVMLTNAKLNTGYPMLGLLTGATGAGKTVACATFINELEPQPHTLSPRGLYINPPPNPTQDRLAGKIVAQAGGILETRTGVTPIDQAIDILVDSEIDLLIIDEADLLDTDCFNAMRYIFDEARISILLVGPPPLNDKLITHQKLKGRIGSNKPFHSLKRQEFLDTFLPNVRMPSWHYDSENSADKAMGQFIWERAKGTLSIPIDILKNAAMLASAQNVAQIDLNLLVDAYKDLFDQIKESKPAAA